MTDCETGRRTRTRRETGWRSLYVIWRQERERELSSNRSCLYSRAATTSAHIIQRSRQNLRGYIDNGIVVLTMNNAIVNRPEKLAN